MSLVVIVSSVRFGSCLLDLGHLQLWYRSDKSNLRIAVRWSGLFSELVIILAFTIIVLRIPVPVVSLPEAGCYVNWCSGWLAYRIIANQSALNGTNLM